MSPWPLDWLARQRRLLESDVFAAFTSGWPAPAEVNVNVSSKADAKGALAMLEGYKAGAYTRQLFSSTWAVPETKNTLHPPYYSLTPPKQPLNNPWTRPLSHRKRLR
jgi:hypothetical protein